MFHNTLLWVYLFILKRLKMIIDISYSNTGDTFNVSKNSVIEKSSYSQSDYLENCFSLKKMLQRKFGRASKRF